MTPSDLTTAPDIPVDRVLEFPDNRLLIDLCGAYDAHLAAIEKALEVQIVRRGNHLSVLGEADAADRAASLLNALYARLEGGRSVEPADIDSALRMGGSDAGDDGAEGYMSPHVSRQGIPVCHRGNVCGVMETDQFFATDSYRIHSAGRARLLNFFQTTGAVSYIITGHTDSRASDAYNMRLSYNRANAVAAIASQAGARIADVRGYGERLPAAPNNTAAGMAKNRRVEIICIR